jgi:hypothetical protein
MKPGEAERCAANLRLAFEMHDLGVALMRQNLRRRYPEAPESRIEEELRRWLQAPSGDPFFP